MTWRGSYDDWKCTPPLEDELALGDEEQDGDDEMEQQRIEDAGDLVRRAQEAFLEGDEVALADLLEQMVARLEEVALADLLEQMVARLEDLPVTPARGERGRAAAAVRVVERRIAAELARGDLLRGAAVDEAEGGGLHVSLFLRGDVSREELLAEMARGLGGVEEDAAAAGAIEAARAERAA